MFILVTIIFQIVFSQQDLNNMFLYNDQTRETWHIRLASFVFHLIPSFTFSNCFGAIVKVGATHLDPESIQWVQGRKYSWDDFMSEEKGDIVLGFSYTMPSGFSQLVVLWLDIFLYLGLAWYFDHVVESNRGVSDSMWFMFTRKYWQSWRVGGQSEDERRSIRAERVKKSKKRKTEKVMADY